MPEHFTEGSIQTPPTVQQAYREPAIADIIRADLASKRSPLQYVHDGYLRYFEQRQGVIDENSRKIGMLSLELFMFLAGGNEFGRLVQETTVEFYEKELERKEQLEAKQPPQTQEL